MSSSSLLFAGCGVAFGFLLGILWSYRRLGRTDGIVSRWTLEQIAKEDTGDTIDDVERRIVYGAYQAASELLEAAIAQSPNDPALRSKHLEVLMIWGDGVSFLDRALEYESVLRGSSEWEKAKFMAAVMYPDDEIFQ